MSLLKIAVWKELSSPVQVFICMGAAFMFVLACNWVLIAILKG